jgi:uncharacterized protein (TIGR03437 family)
MRGLVLLIPIACFSASAATTTLGHFANTTVNAATVDAAGNIYLAGYLGTHTAFDSWDAFVTKLSPDGSKVFYTTKFAGSKSDMIGALQVDGTGAVYVLGQTRSVDFPVTPAVVQGTFQSDAQGFVAKVDPQGNVVYATLIGEDSQIDIAGGSIVVNAAGQAFVSARANGGSFPPVPSAPPRSNFDNPAFIVKLSVDGTKILGAVRRLGGRLALDSQENVYVAGSAYGTPDAIPITPGAFQSTFRLNACGGTGQLAFACFYQHVAKLSPDLSQLIYSTYVTGSYGGTPAAISVDSQGNALVVGTTNSPDYPTTGDAFQPNYIADQPQPFVECLFGCVIPPPATGFLTRLNATGTGLIYSTFFSGSQTDTITFGAIRAGGIYLAGQAGSDDLPGLDGTPVQCLPATYETHFTPDGLAVAGARLVLGTVVAYDPATNTFLAWNRGDLIRFDPADAPPKVGCILDAASLEPVTSVAPGQMLAIFGPRFAIGASIGGPKTYPTTLNGVSVTIGGTPAPLLYVSPQQINLQVPFEIAKQQSVDLVVQSQDFHISEGRMLTVATANPSVYLDTSVTAGSPGFGNCGLAGGFFGGAPIITPLAFNSDGTRNSCLNPAPRGTTVKLILEGLGVTGQAVTGAINPDPPMPLALPVTTSAPNAPVVSATALPGALTGIWQVEVLPQASGGAFPIALYVNITPDTRLQVGDKNLTIWLK